MGLSGYVWHGMGGTRKKIKTYPQLRFMATNNPGHKLRKKNLNNKKRRHRKLWEYYTISDNDYQH